MNLEMDRPMEKSGGQTPRGEGLAKQRTKGLRARRARAGDELVAVLLGAPPFAHLLEVRGAHGVHAPGATRGARVSATRKHIKYTDKP